MDFSIENREVMPFELPRFALYVNNLNPYADTTVFCLFQIHNMFVY